MKNSTKIVIGAVAAAALAAAVPVATALANNVSAPQRSMMHKETTQLAVTNVYPVSTTQVNIAVNNTMALQGKSITLTPTHTSGMEMAKTPLMAKYNAMDKGFVLTGMHKLTPGVTYTVHAGWANLAMNHDRFTIPDLLRVQEVSSHQLEVIYGQRVDLMSATTPGNFWVKSNQAVASGIAELGMNDKVTPTDGLTQSKVKITERGNSGRTFVFTFASPITKGVQYTLIPCGVSAAGEQGYMGANFNMSSHNTFVGQNLM